VITLEAIPLFRQLNRDELQALRFIAQERQFTAGQEIFREDTPGDGVYFVKSGLVEEGAEVIEEDGNEAVLDAALIGAAQRVEHYEIAGYGVVRTFATLLGENDAAELLQETLDEEAAADKKLTEIAEEDINFEALSEDDEEEQKVPRRGGMKKVASRR